MSYLKYTKQSNDPLGLGALAVWIVLFVIAAGASYLICTGLVALTQFGLWHMGLTWAAQYNTWAAGFVFYLLCWIFNMMTSPFRSTK